MKKNNESGSNSFIAFGFGSSDIGVNLYWSNDALKTIEKYVHEENRLDNQDRADSSNEKSQNEKN